MGKDIDPDTHRDKHLNPAIAVFRSKARAKIAIHDLYNVIGDSRLRWTLLFTGLMLMCSAGTAAASMQQVFTAFNELYTTELHSTTRCQEGAVNQYRVCAESLRNEGNGPFILHHGKPTKNVAVLFHGLSDSPYFMRALAAVLHDRGFTVVVPLLPGHGLRQADAAMEDSQLAERWQQHVEDIMALSQPLGERFFVGGFSTGGALAVDHYLDAPEDIAGVMLFSGALTLTDNAETMHKIWGIKTLAKLIDGEYETHGPNPYKYPAVAGFAGLELMDVIRSIRTRLEEGQRIKVPVFAAHSQADNTTPIKGVKRLLEFADGTNTFFEIDKEYDLCHADLPLNRKLVADMHFKTNMVNAQERCAVPKANPLYRQMIFMLEAFVSAHTEITPGLQDSNRPRPYISYDDFKQATGK